MNSEVVSRSLGLDVSKFVDDRTNVPGSYVHRNTGEKPQVHEHNIWRWQN